MTPNDVKQKRNVSAAAAESAGASCGSVTSRARRQGPAPSTAAASALRGSTVAQAPPTIRVTTATLKKTCAARIAQTPRLAPGREQLRETPSRRRPSAGRTGRARARATSERPRKRNRPSAQASGSPAASVSAVEAAACQIVNQSELRRSRQGRNGPPPDVSPRSRIVTSGKTKKNARNASGHDRGGGVPSGSAQDGACPFVDPAVAVARRSRPRGARAGCAGETA